MNTSVVKERLATAVAVAGFALAGCSGGGTPLTPTQANLGGDILELAVGTANVPGGVVPRRSGLNVVVTFRQPAGALSPGGSAVLVSTPTLSGPFTLPALAGTAGADPTSTVVSGPAPSEAGTASIGGTPQGGSGVTSLGTSGGAFGLGLEPFNYGDGAPFTNVPYPVPLYRYAIEPAISYSFVPWGGPPAFDLAGNGQSVVGSSSVPAGQAGLSEGLDVFAGVAPRVGTYSLAVKIPANTSQPTVTATAKLVSTALLGAATAPIPGADGAGGTNFLTVLPAGVTEAYFQITDVGPASGNGCNGASAAGPIYYTIEVTAAVPSGKLPNAAGPGGTPSICSSAQNTAANGGTATPGDQFIAQTVGFDYPLYENSYTTGSSAVTPAPALAGPNGQADITISAPVEYVPVTTGVPGPTARYVAKPLLVNPLSKRR